MHRGGTTEKPAIFFDDAADFRAWLEANHETAAELWMGLYKKHVPERGLHGFRGRDHARMLLMFTPGAPREDYFETLHALGYGATMTDDERVEFMLQHDTYWV